MKKNKSKSKNHSASKKERKELESKLAVAFNEVVSTYGKAKKADKLIEKFAKQLSKKISIPAQQAANTPVAEAVIPLATIEEIAKPKAKKQAPVKKDS
ncbi:hypothetical protein [Pedobacter rhizosphaerae]|uniref:Uncharacterized protein n=1 Tax=Pedobacter rhizosphaerae TaxID=390241 RepID=A0A1H9QB81_9SPHI|nr:hypothetical protein [Pedobacter rhizosphaerae]SER57093.1 hypothetical protein SAMN04488023_11190 [Pedobacter rhizosphaerae]